MKRVHATILVLGLILLSVGIFLLLENRQEITLPEEKPIITTNASYNFGGKSFTLYVYKGGDIIYIEETNMRLQIPPDDEAIRIWKKGKIQNEELIGLLQRFKIDEFNELPTQNNFLGLKLEDGSLGFGDMYYTVTMNYGDIDKTVHAARYISFDDEKTYPDMPYPVNEIYRISKQIIDNRTREVYRESIKE